MLLEGRADAFMGGREERAHFRVRGARAVLTVRLLLDLPELGEGRPARPVVRRQPELGAHWSTSTPLPFPVASSVLNCTGASRYAVARGAPGTVRAAQ